MRKLIAFFLIVVLLPAAALSDESGIIGFWANCGLNEDNTPFMHIYYLSEDHVCYSMLKSFSSFYYCVEKSDTGTWELQEDGTIKTLVKNARYYWQISDSLDSIVNMKTGDIYFKVAESDPQSR